MNRNALDSVYIDLPIDLNGSSSGVSEFDAIHDVTHQQIVRCGKSLKNFPHQAQ